jgi:GABA(A) receptor-associated protein
MDFKAKYNFEQRSQESKKVRLKYPTRTPIYVSKASTSTLNDIDKHKFIVPNDLTISQFIYVIRKRITNLKPEDAIYIFIDGMLPTQSSLVSTVYNTMKSPDGFLYVTYTNESTFG